MSTSVSADDINIILEMIRDNLQLDNGTEVARRKSLKRMMLAQRLVGSDHPGFQQICTLFVTSEARRGNQSRRETIQEATPDDVASEENNERVHVIPPDEESTAARNDQANEVPVPEEESETVVFGDVVVEEEEEEEEEEEGGGGGGGGGRTEEQEPQEEESGRGGQDEGEDEAAGGNDGLDGQEEESGSEEESEDEDEARSFPFEENRMYRSTQVAVGNRIVGVGPGYRQENGVNQYVSRNGNVHDMGRAPPGDCFNCGGRHWRVNCPFARGNHTIFD